MNEGFFSLISAPTGGSSSRELVPECGACGLWKGCKSPRMAIDGEGRQEILVVGEAPGRNEDEWGQPFVGDSGRLLDSELRRLDIDLRRDCWITNSAICRPTDKAHRNRTPTDKEVGYCRPNVINAIRKLKPTTIVLLGKCAVQSVIGWVWRENVGPISRWIGWTIPDRKTNAWLCPSWHPSFILHEIDARGSGGENPVVRMMWRNQLKAAFSLEGRPWPDPPPDPARRVVICRDIDKAATFLRGCIEDGGPISFDFETNMKKPDSPAARIHSCAVCLCGKTTMAYPWQGEAIKATGELLKANNPKIGYNLKFEERWTRREFGHGVTNWVHDGMEAAHVLDCRPGITGLKFQAFVKLGVGPYDFDAAQYLKSGGGGGYDRNRIFQADLGMILKYCGIDAYLEYKLAEIQREELGLPAL